MKNLFTLILCLLQFQFIEAKEYYNFRNEVYDEQIKTVTFEVNNLPTNFPAITLNSGQFIMLKFDDLLNEERILYYRLIHCDKNWNPSTISEIEAFNGFNDERLRNYSYSINTKVPYIHYWQQFPNKDIQFKISGNYLLVIYEDNIEYPIISRRFVIKENRVGVEMKSVFPADVENIRYKQELNVSINFEGFKMRNPMDEISLMVMQNENWNTAITSKPSFFTVNNLRFNKLNTFAWWGLTEYRDFDTRSLMRLGRGVKFIERAKNETDVILMTDQSRRNKVHLANFDFNGRFIIENFERLRQTTTGDVLDRFINTTNADANLRQSLRDSIIGSIIRQNNLIDGEYTAEERNIRSDYTNVTFVLDDMINLQDEDIYVLGSMNNWLPSEEYRMKYDSKRDLYLTEVVLKQGYYNYMYGVINKKDEVDYPVMEGSWNETENEYQALVYYRGLGDLYDRVIGFSVYNTNSERTSIR
ncbi:MAG: hypothetical protein RIR48_92 [Bacteroidota bacterium]|jgi:hypothetical protein